MSARSAWYYYYYYTLCTCWRLAKIVRLISSVLVISHSCTVKKNLTKKDKGSVQMNLADTMQNLSKKYSGDFPEVALFSRGTFQCHPAYFIQQHFHREQIRRRHRATVRRKRHFDCKIQKLGAGITATTNVGSTTRKLAELSVNPRWASTASARREIDHLLTDMTLVSRSTEML